MATLLSPGVAWSEVDLTTIVPGLSTTVGGFAGNFNWGPVNKLTTISSEIDLVNTFGQPDSNTFTSFFTVANFLSYTQNALVVRAADLTATKNATSGRDAILIQNKDIYEYNYMNGQANDFCGMFAARYPSSLGNGLKVSVWASANSTAFASWEYQANFNGVPGTSNYVSKVAANANDEMHIIVVDTLGNFGTPNAVLEKYSYVSKASDATNDDGTSNYWINVISSQSKYVYIINNAISSNANVASLDTTTWGLTSSQIVSNGGQFNQGNNYYTSTMAGGFNGNPTDGDITTGYNLFKDHEQSDVSLLMAGAADATVATYIISNIAESRRDLVTFISPPMSTVVNNLGNEATQSIAFKNNLAISSSYVVMDSGWKKQFDKYNNVYRWVPLNGDIAGLCAKTDYTNASWWSPAGLNRGLIKNVTQIAWSPNQAERDNLYKNSINPVVAMQGVGTVFYGDKTLTSKPSAFDRINVRRLFIELEQSISKAAKYSLFEFNDEFTRAQFVALVDPFLRNIKGQRGIYDYQIVCDTTNNTPAVIDRNQFVGDIYIKPARAINFIQLNFVAVGTGVAFSEVVGKTGAA